MKIKIMIFMKMKIMISGEGATWWVVMDAWMHENRNKRLIAQINEAIFPGKDCSLSGAIQSKVQSNLNCTKTRTYL